MAVTVALLAVPAAASAANGPTFRDCSLIFGFDADYVQLTGATVGPDGTLTVPSSQSTVTVEAAESPAYTGTGQDSLTVTVSGTGINPTTVSGTAAGPVYLTVPLAGVAPGGHYSLDWSATFEDGNQCPGFFDPSNPGSNPFVLNVVGGQASAPPVVSDLRESAHRWSKRAGTTFSFHLSERAQVTLLFRRNRIPMGARLVSGRPGQNFLRFHGKVYGTRLRPGRYLVLVTATNTAGQSSSPQALHFTIKPRSARRA